MYCSNCGKEIDNDSKFCQYCGYSLEEKENLTIVKQDINKNNASYSTSAAQAKTLVNFVKILTFVVKHFAKIIILIVIIGMTVSYMVDVGFEKNANEFDKSTLQYVTSQYKKTIKWKQKERTCVHLYCITTENAEPEIISIHYLPFKKDCSDGEGMNAKLYHADSYYNMTLSNNYNHNVKYDYKKEEISFCEYIDKDSSAKKIKFWMGHK